MKYDNMISMNQKLLLSTVIIACSLYATAHTTVKPTKVGFLFSHGLADDGSQAYNYAREYSLNGINYTNDRYIMQEPIITFNYPDAQGIIAQITRVDFRKTDLGQIYEIQSLEKAYRKASEQCEEIVAIGLSRGASALIDWLPGKQRPNIKALVLESPFHSFIGLLKDRFTHPWAHTFITMLVKYGIPFFRYDLDGLHPIDMVNKLPKELPILLVCSDQDETVPAHSTIKLAKELKNIGHKNTYLVRIRRGKHAHLLDGPDGEFYQKVTNAFYKRYNIPHNPLLAAEGMALLDQCAI